MLGCRNVRNGPPRPQGGLLSLRKGDTGEVWMGRKKTPKGRNLLQGELPPDPQ